MAPSPHSEGDVLLENQFLGKIQQFGVLQRQACRLLVQHGVERILDRTPDQCF